MLLQIDLDVRCMYFACVSSKNKSISNLQGWKLKKKKKTSIGRFLYLRKQDN